MIYTLRKLQGFAHELAKWDDRTQPLDTYLMRPPSGSRGESTGAWSCSCPSPRNPCKHQDIRRALMDDPRELAKIGFDEKLGIIELGDL